MTETPCEYGGDERRKRCTFADAAADAAVKKTFAILGVDVDDPQQVKQFQISLRFGEKLSKFVDKGFFASASIMAGLVALFIGWGFLSLVAEKLKGLKWW